MQLTITAGAGAFLIIMGLAGAVVPILPGPLLIWLGAVVWASGDSFSNVGWVTLTILGLLALLAWALDLALTTVLTRRAGASWRSIGGAIVGGLLGGIFLSGIPILGTLSGALAGALGGMWLAEYMDKQDGRAAWRAVRAYLVGFLISAAAEIAIALLMVGIFFWQLVG